MRGRTKIRRRQKRKRGNRKKRNAVRVGVSLGAVYTVQQENACSGNLA